MATAPSGDSAPVPIFHPNQCAKSLLISSLSRPSTTLFVQLDPCLVCIYVEFYPALAFRWYPLHRAIYLASLAANDLSLKHSIFLIVSESRSLGDSLSFAEGILQTGGLKSDWGPKIILEEFIGERTNFEMDLLTMFVMAALPVLKIFITCGFGAYLGHPSVNILTQDGRKLLNKLVVVAFTPAFVFTKLARAVSYENILAWWYMPINVCLCFFCGLALGFVVLKNTNVPPHLRNLVLACCAAGNTGNVPLVLIPAICEEEGNPFGRSEACIRNAMAYVSYGMWVGIALTWTVVYRLLQPPDFQKEGPAPPVGSHGGSPRPPIGSYGGSPRLSEFGDFQAGKYEMEEFNPRMEAITVATSTGSKQKGLSSGTVLTSPRSQVSTNMSPRASSPPAPDIAAIAYFLFYFEKYDLKKVFNPPTCAAILGVTVGGIPFLKSLCEGPFLVFIESGEIIGQAMIPAMNMVLGATLVQGAGVSELEMPTIIGTILVRLVANPIVGMILTKIAHDWGMLPPDPLFRFVLMVQFTMPTAINVGTLAQLFSVGEKETAILLFYAYLSASVFMTFWIIIYLNYIF